MIQIDVPSKSSMNLASMPDPSSQTRLIEEASDWFARLHADDVTTEDRSAFDRWKAQSPAHSRAYASISRLWETVEEPSRAAWQAQEHAANPSPSARPISPLTTLLRRRRLAIGLALAAGIAVLMTISAWMPDAFEVWQSDFTTTTGEQRQVALADGSAVLLNTQSALALASWQNRREVTLVKGEAAFSITSDAKRPFVVTAGAGEIRVVGTKFSVRKRQDRVTVTVTEGTVTVGIQAAGEPVRIQAGQEVSYDVHGIGTVTKANLMKALAWQRGQLVFTLEPLAGVIDELNRYHSGAMILANPALRHRVVSGVFATDDPLRVINAVTKTLHVRSLSIADRFVLLY